MKPQFTTRLAAAAILLAIGTTKPCAQETVVIQHTGAADPLTEGWSLKRSGTPSLAPVANDFGADAWSIGLHSLSDFAAYSVRFTPEQVAEAAGRGWVVSLTLRVVAPYNSQPSGTGFDLFVDSQYYLFHFGAASNGDPMIRVENSPDGLHTLNGAGPGYHNYQLRYDVDSLSASLWVDGAQYLDRVQGSTTVLTPGMHWGGDQDAAPGTYANWSEVSFSIIPEPSAVALLMSGALLVAFRRLGGKKQATVGSAGSGARVPHRSGG